MYRFAAPLIAPLLLLASPAAAAWVSPDEFVAGIYREQGAAIPKARLAGYYSRDLAAALARAEDADDGGVGFDWLYGAQDAEINDLTFIEIAGGPDGSLIEARFRNFGEEVAVQWTLCRRDNGDWRVTEVAGGDSWSLRRILHLPQEATDC